MTSRPDEAARHADTIFLGPGEDTWPRFLQEFRGGQPADVYRSRTRTLVAVPPVRRDLIKRPLYLVPNSIVVSRGCPHVCDFCWDRYDTRHAVFRPARMSAAELEEGYRRAYHDFYRWRSIARGAAAHDGITSTVRHFAYAAGWKKFEPLWGLVIRAKQTAWMRPVLEALLNVRRTDGATTQKSAQQAIASSL